MTTEAIEDQELKTRKLIRKLRDIIGAQQKFIDHIKSQMPPAQLDQIVKTYKK